MKKDKLETRLDELEEYFQNELNKINKELDSFKKQKIQNINLFSITTYSEVCKILNEKEEILPYLKIKQIQKLYNGDWKIDWSNINQKKYYSYFNLNASRGLVGFTVSIYCLTYSLGQVAFYKDEKTSNYVGKIFYSIYKEFIEQQ